MSGFDPENDLCDRRVFFEVTGDSIIPDEFWDDNSSSEEEKNPRVNAEDDPFDWVFSHAKVSDEENGQDQN